MYFVSPASLHTSPKQLERHVAGWPVASTLDRRDDTWCPRWQEGTLLLFCFHYDQPLRIPLPQKHSVFCVCKCCCCCCCCCVHVIYLQPLLSSHCSSSIVPEPMNGRGELCVIGFQSYMVQVRPTLNFLQHLHVCSIYRSHPFFPACARWSM